MPRVLWTVWVLGAAISLLEKGALDQASSVNCDSTGVCDGHSKSLNFIPSGLPATVKSLDLSNNKITYVSSSDLRACVNLQALRLGSNRINAIQEDSFLSLGSLEHLDLSYNHLNNLSSSWFRPLSSLKFLNLLGNPYKTLGKTSLFSHLTNLRILKVGNNYFTEIREKDFAGLTFLQELEIDASNLQRYEPKSLKSIQNVSCLILHIKQPVFLQKIFVDILSSLEYLELIDTHLNTFHFSEVSINKTNTLIKKFTFRNVEITDEGFNELVKLLPYASEALDVEFEDCTLNGIGDFDISEQLDSFKKLKTLEAGGNNFICSCEFLRFTQEQQALAQILIDWPGNYLCDSPSHVRGHRVQDTHLSISECHRTALVSALCCALFLFILLTVVLCHHFHGLWYMKMMWAWLQAKRKPKKAPHRDICYDAFVSYSERDSHWVENLMVQELEHFDPPFKLCLHKRDFVPGKWIIDNIIDSIEKSHKTVFVLSENFVKSEWCKYELDFSHFRLFDENNDAAILILLEPIEKKTIPQRFCKLRKMMNTKTYLEWPTDEAQQEGFWLNLRTAIKS
ncbi:Toll-like receptor 2 [Pteropus alecto]|uniref:Toll-like receptor 2 n=1 Tax=Pteropus alecto TaxID=9402 RepID=L5L252_PTEAL|nr:Toll-like receptor 2 [Pteropus alecto]